MGVCGFFLSVKFVTSLLALLAGDTLLWLEGVPPEKIRVFRVPDTFFSLLTIP